MINIHQEMIDNKYDQKKNIVSDTNDWAGHFSIAYINQKNKNKS